MKSYSKKGNKTRDSYFLDGCNGFRGSSQQNKIYGVVRIYPFHPDHIVRVAGYSDYFVHLSPNMQEEVIARTEFGN